MNRIRLSAAGLGVAIVGLVLTVNCGDAPPAARIASPRVGQAPGAPAAITTPTPAPVRARGADALAEMHARPTEWVGRGHNAAVVAFAADLKRNGSRGMPLCRRIERFLLEMPAPDGGSLPRGQARRDAVALGMAAVPSCAAARRTSALGDGASLHLARQASTGISLMADQYRIEMEDDIMNATDAASLAASLNDVVARAYASLSADEAQAVEAAASVGQSSYESWLTNYDSFSASIATAYGGCFTSYLDAGYSDDAVLSACYEGTGMRDPGPLVQPLRGAPDAGRGTLRFASDVAPAARTDRPGLATMAPTPYFCGGTISAGFKSIGSDDLQGAFVGGFSGIMGGPGGIFTGALLGGAGASIFRAGALAYRDWKCAMERT